MSKVGALLRQAAASVARFPGRFPILAALPVYVFGVIWRWQHIYERHDPRNTVFSDMAMYVGNARRLADPSYVLTKYDVTHPPAASWLFGLFYTRDESFYELTIFQFFVSALIPLAVAWLAWVAFDKRCAAWALVLSSCYFNYVEFAGFFLAEVYMQLLIPACMACYLTATSGSLPRRVGFAILAGILFMISVAFKTVAGPALAGFFAVHWLFTSGLRRPRTLALALMVASSLPGLALVGARCTKANDGQFCLPSNKSASDFLLGHYDRVGSIQWTDATFGSPSAIQHGYTNSPKVPFSITDKERNMETAWQWIDDHPLESAVLSVQHVFDMFAPNAPWPTIWTAEWPIAQAQMYLFVIFFIWPSMLLLFEIGTVNGPLAMLRSTECAVASVLVGVSLGVFIATGEPRYRLPYDCVFIVLGVQFYRRMLARHGWRLFRRAYHPGHLPTPTSPASSI